MKGDRFTGMTASPAPFMRSCPYQAIMLDGLLGSIGGRNAPPDVLSYTWRCLCLSQVRMLQAALFLNDWQIDFLLSL
jgi:hypothetical protein